MLNAAIKCIIVLWVGLFINCLIATEVESSPNQYHIDIVAGRNPDMHSYEIRAQSIAKINNNLTDAELNSIKEFLHEKRPDNISVLAYNSLKNELVRIILRQNRQNELVCDWLIEMFADKKNEITWRDYCVQFLGLIYPRSSAEYKVKIKDELINALKELDNGVAGASLIALYHNIDEKNIEKKFVSDSALSLVNNSKCPEYVLTSAMQIAAMCGNSKIIPRCRYILENPTGHSINLKAAAVAALGTLNDAGTIDLIKPYLTNSDIRISAAAKSAMEKLVRIKK
ncbi:MAG: hypothetical protein RRY34_03995 [Victivallaceae bacterium]